MPWKSPSQVSSSWPSWWLMGSLHGRLFATSSRNHHREQLSCWQSGWSRFWVQFSYLRSIGGLKSHPGNIGQYLMPVTTSEYPGDRSAPRSRISMTDMASNSALLTDAFSSLRRAYAAAKRER